MVNIITILTLHITKWTIFSSFSTETAIYNISVMKLPQQALKFQLQPLVLQGKKSISGCKKGPSEKESCTECTVPQAWVSLHHCMTVFPFIVCVPTPIHHSPCCYISVRLSKLKDWLAKMSYR